MRASLTDGSFLDALLKNDPGNGEFDSQWQPKTLPASPVIAYLLPALTDRRFQEGLKNYRDIAIARNILVDAGSDMDASLSLLDAQRDIYARWQHYTQRGNKDVSPPALMMQIKKLQGEVMMLTPAAERGEIEEERGEERGEERRKKQTWK